MNFGASHAVKGGVKKAVLKPGGGKAEFIRTKVAPVHDSHEARFGLVDILMIIALVGATIGIARLLLAH